MKFIKLKIRDIASMGVGGDAKTYIFNNLDNIDDVRSIIANSKFFILGGGSNILVSDNLDHELDDRICIKVENCDLKIEEFDDHFIVSVGAGMSLDELALKLAEKNIQSFQMLAGIPGTIGAAPVQNAGAYGAEIGPFVDHVEVIRVKDVERDVLNQEQCHFTYRRSIFNTLMKNEYFIYNVVLKIDKVADFKIPHREIIKAFGGEIAKPSDAMKLRDAVLKVRAAKGMLVGDEYFKSCGSFFNNPIVTKTTVETILKRYPEMPHYEVEGGYKIPAAWLIAQTEFKKGYVHKHVGVSPLHNLSLINLGDGTTHEILELGQMIQLAVYDEFRIALNIEPVTVC